MRVLRTTGLHNTKGTMHFGATTTIRAPALCWTVLTNDRRVLRMKLFASRNEPNQWNNHSRAQTEHRNPNDEDRVKYWCNALRLSHKLTLMKKTACNIFCTSLEMKPRLPVLGAYFRRWRVEILLISVDWGSDATVWALQTVLVLQNTAKTVKVWVSSFKSEESQWTSPRGSTAFFFPETWNRN